MLATIAIIAVGWLPSWVSSRGDESPASTVDYSSELAQARAEAPYNVLAPSSVPSGWRATSVEWSGDGPEKSWHLGFLTNEGNSADYVAVEQSNARPDDFIARFPADTPAPAVSIAGATWTGLTTADGSEHALVLTNGDVTTLVTGTAPESDLEDFAASLSSG